jgi:hypothetical protein
MTADAEGQAIDDLEQSVRDLVISLAIMDNSIRDLEEDVQVKAAAITAQTKAIRRRNKLVFILVFILLGGGAWMTVDNRHRIDATQHKFCPLIEPFVPRPGDPPPSGTPDQVARANQIRQAFIERAHDFHCNVT